MLFYVKNLTTVTKKHGKRFLSADSQISMTYFKLFSKEDFDLGNHYLLKRIKVFLCRNEVLKKLVIITAKYICIPSKEGKKMLSH